MSRPARKSRREFLVDLLRGAAVAGGAGLAWGHVVGVSKAAGHTVRPPGAREEDDFLAMCIKCGQCAEACPFDTIRMARADDPRAIGAPFFVPREVPCYMCPRTPCIEACPTDALVKGTDIEKADMGLAVLIDQESCVAFQGLRCEVCYRVCPKMGQAIKLEFAPQERTGKHAFFIPVVQSDECTGCGMCEHSCILAESAIKVLPRDVAQGRLGDNYRIGWKEDARISRDFRPDDATLDAAAPGTDASRLDSILDEMNDLGGIVE